MLQTAGKSADTSAMTNAPGPSFGERFRAARAASVGLRIHPVATWTGWGFVLFAAIAVGYGLWTLYGSGSTVLGLDLASAASRPRSPELAAPPASWIGQPGATLGPFPLEPGMNPLRAVLNATYAPVGSTRIRFEIEIADLGGAPILAKQGALGSRDDDASIVRTTESLGDFRLAQAGGYFVRARITEDGMDDLRALSLELRRNVVPVDARIVWGFGIAAVVCLIVSHVVARRSGWPYRLEEPGSRTAA